MSNNPNIEWIVWSFLNEGNLDETKLLMPLNKKKPTKYFVNNSNDVFQENTRFEWIDKIMAVIALCPQHTFQLLTKRPERMKEYFRNRSSYFNQDIEDFVLQIVRKDDIIFKNNKNNEWINLFKQHTDEGEYKAYCVISNEALPNLWLGVSVENQEQADKRIPYLLETPAKIRFLSCEPLLEFIHLAGFDGNRISLYEQRLHGTGLDWVIVGGESGNNARPMHPDWVRSIRNQCQVANIPFFFKGWGSWVSESPSDLKGYLKEHDKKLTCFKVPNSGFFETNLDTFVYENDQTIPKVLLKVGKKQSGCLLDGKEYKEYPKY